jgi:hypothetical protein
MPNISRRREFRRWTAGVVAFVGAGLAACAGDWGPLYCDQDDVQGSDRVLAAGPFWESRESVSGGMSFTALRPFYSCLEVTDRAAVSRDYLWPVAMSRTLRTDHSWRFLLAYGHDFCTTNENPRYRFVLFPLLMTGRGHEGNSYFGLFPVGGSIEDVLGRDRVSFFLFPLYGHSVQNDLDTTSVLWPIFSRTQGDGVDRWRVFPFYGHSWRTNEWTKQFVLWPFWTSVRYEYPRHSGGGHILFPFYGHIRAGDEETWMFLPPLFRWTRGDKQDRLNLPWPVFQSGQGTVDKRYLWPVWGRKEMEGSQSGFCLWPLFSWSSVDMGDQGHVNRFRVVPLLNVERRSKPGPSNSTERVHSRYAKVWPLFEREMWATDQGTNRMFRLLDLWPIRGSQGVERNWSSFWTLYSRAESDAGRTESQFLWGLYRHRVSAPEVSRSVSVFPLYSSASHGTGAEAGREWSILGGLLGRRQEGLRGSVRLLYLLSWETGPGKGSTPLTREERE